MFIKLCGLNTVDSITEASKLNLEMIGINFYPNSVRYIGNLAPLKVHSARGKAKCVGVTVNMAINQLIDLHDIWRPDYWQLHGDESPQYCSTIRRKAHVIKVLRIHQDFNFDIAKDYDMVEYLLFDTYTPSFGGAGQKFDWNKLNEYRGSIPFILSGGIACEDVKLIKSIHHPMLKGVDINSKFESEPGIKDMKLIKTFVEEVRL